MPIVKLSYQQVQEIRALQGEVSSNVLGEVFNVSGRQIRRIWKGDRWKKELYETREEGNNL